MPSLPDLEKKKSTVSEYSNENIVLSDGYTDGIIQDITSSLESLETVMLYDRIKKSNNEQKIRMIKRLNNVYTKSISNKQVVNSIENWNNRQIEETCLVDHYTISTEGLKNIFDKIIEIISKIIRAITDVIRKILGKKTKKEIINRLKEELREANESQRARFVRDTKEKLSIFQDWFPNVDNPVFPDLSSYDVSKFRAIMSEINKINSQFIKLSEGIGLGPRATHERITDSNNMTRLLEEFEKKFLNGYSVSNADLKENGPYVRKRRGYMISMLNLKPKVYAPNSNNSGSTFSIFTDFVEKHEKFTNDVNSIFLNPLKISLTGMEHSINIIRSCLDKAYGDTGYEKLTILSSTYVRITSNIQRVYVFPLTYMLSELTSATAGITNDKMFHDDTARHIDDYYGSEIKKYEKKLF